MWKNISLIGRITILELYGIIVSNMIVVTMP